MHEADFRQKKIKKVYNVDIVARVLNDSVQLKKNTHFLPLRAPSLRWIAAKLLIFRAYQKK